MTATDYAVPSIAGMPPGAPEIPVAVDGAPDGNWDFAGQDTQYATHGIHTYVAAMIPALARRLIDTYAPAGGAVLDPFCGGGAVLVEAIRSGRQAVGRDINHLAVMVSKAKTTHIEADAIRATGAKVMTQAMAYDGPAVNFSQSDFVEYWFKDYMMMPLTGIRSAVENIRQRELRNLFQALFSATVRSVSLTHRNEVRLRRMTPEQQESFNPDVISVFNKYVELAAQRVPALPPGASVAVARGDTRQLDLPDDGVDTIVCSPPYGDERNGVNYTQFSKNMLYWLGYSRKQMQSSKNASLGWGKWHRTVPPSASLHRAISRLSDQPGSVQEAVAFYADYYAALRQMARVTRGHIVIVIGNRVLNKQVLHNGQITVDLMDALGVPLLTCHNRKLPTKRLPKMREAGAAIDQEYILVFKK